jgi:hypothetical protein
VPSTRALATLDAMNATPAHALDARPPAPMLQIGDHPAPRPPLHPGLPLLGSLVPMVRRPVQLFLDCFRAHGPVSRIRVAGRELVVFAGPDAMQLLAREERNLFAMKPIYGEFEQLFGAETSLIGADGDLHTDLRKRFKPSMSRTRMDACLPTAIGVVRERIARRRPGEELEQRVFFGDARTAPVANLVAQGSRGPAKFPGCAYCHTVAPSETGAPHVSQPVIPDRWLVRGAFDHGKHFKVACVACHEAGQSRETSEVLLPTKASCVECHSPQGGVANSCSTCHSFHTPRKETRAAK